MTVDLPTPDIPVMRTRFIPQYSIEYKNLEDQAHVFEVIVSAPSIEALRLDSIGYETEAQVQVACRYARRGHAEVDLCNTFHHPHLCYYPLHQAATNFLTADFGSDVHRAEGYDMAEF